MNALELVEAIKKKQIVIGWQQFLPSPNIVEIAALAGFDWLWLCVEHGTSGYGAELENCIRAAESSKIVPLVRVTEPKEHFIYMRAFEAGAKGVIVPRVKTKEDVEFAVRACKWPPRGDHGLCTGARRWKYGVISQELYPYDFINRAENEMIIAPLIEQKEAIENLDDILSVEGITFVIFGASDLAVSLGTRGRGKALQEKGEKMIERYRQTVLQTCKEKGVPLCQLYVTVEHARRLIEEDGTFILASEPGPVVIRKSLKAYVQGIKGE